MTHYILLVISTALINNFVLVKFLGLCPFMGVSKKIETAIGMGLATTFVLTVASLCSYLVDNYILMPLNATFLRTLVFILVIAVVVQFTEMVINKTSPSLYRLLGIFLPLITTNCAVLGVALLNVNLAHNLTESVIYGFGASLGFALVLVLFAAPGSTMIATTKSYIGSLVELVGGKNIIEDNSTSFTTYNKEDLAMLNPEKILVMVHALPEETKAALEAEMASDSAWQNINAVKEGNVIYLDNEYFGMSANLNVIEGLDMLSDIVHGTGE